MNQIGTIAATLFVLIGVFLAAPLLFTHAVRESYEKNWLKGLIQDFPNWVYYIILLFFSLFFWACIGIIIYCIT